MYITRIIATLIFCTFYFSVLAQEEPPEFESDRPDRTEAATVVPRGYFQVESGFLYERDEQQSQVKKQWLYPTTLLRIGVLKRAELRLQADYRREETKSVLPVEQTDKGFSDLRVGTKIKFTEGDGVVPAMAVLAAVTLPAGEDAFEPKHVAPEARLLFSNDITEKIQLEYNLGYRNRREADGMEEQFVYTAALGAEVVDKLTVYAEFFGHKPLDGAAPENNIDGGLRFMLLDNLQLDAIVGTGISSQAPDFFIGGGISLRLPR